ncbi:MAG: hypothetical protein WC770_02070 [Phycisphaerae bacterium]|jgi:uncharacterized alpha/beta hydrolase family protein
MLRKILTIIVIIGIAVTFGCKKTTTETTKKTVTTTKEVEKAVPQDGTQTPK